MVLFPYGKSLFFPWPVFSLCQPGSDAWGSLRHEEDDAGDLCGYQTAPGVLRAHIATSFGWECPPTEGAMAPLVHVVFLARPDVPLTLAICCSISAQHEPMVVNSGQSLLPVTTQVAWKMLFCHSHHNSKKMLSAASLHLCLSRLMPHLQKADEAGPNHRRGEASVIFTWEPFSGLQV